MMNRTGVRYWFVLVALASLVVLHGQPCEAYDIRGPWVGSASGTIFGAKGSVNITHQHGEDIRGIVEGGNVFGSAKFSIAGKIRGNQIFGSKDGHTFHGFLFPNGTIRGRFRAVDGDTYEVILHRPYPYWGVPYGTW